MAKSVAVTPAGTIAHVTPSHWGAAARAYSGDKLAYFKSIVPMVAAGMSTREITAGITQAATERGITADRASKSTVDRARGVVERVILAETTLDLTRDAADVLWTASASGRDAIDATVAAIIRGELPTGKGKDARDARAAFFKGLKGKTERPGAITPGGSDGADETTDDDATGNAGTDKGNAGKDDAGTLASAGTLTLARELLKRVTARAFTPDAELLDVLAGIATATEEHVVGADVDA